MNNNISREEVLAHLAGLLADRRFVAAERNSKFLRYVVEAAIEGKASQIKETVIGTDVYGRPGGYDPKADSIVRVEASRLRQKLLSYYENEGKDTAIRCVLPSGSYVPSFERVAETIPTKPRDVKRPAIAAIAGLAIIVCTMQIARGSRPVHHADGLAAWQEGLALLHQDPHTAKTEKGPPQTLLRAIERLEFAVARNSNWAQGWATLSEAYDYVSSYRGRDAGEDGRRAEDAARRAVALDGKLAAGHHMLALALKGTKWDFAQAEAAYQRALEFDPRNAYASVEYADLLWATGRIEKAATEIRKARAIQPALPVLAAKEAEIQLGMGRVDAAMATAKSALEMKSTYLRAYVVLGMGHERKGETAEALKLYEHVLRTNPTDRRALPAYGYLLARSGKTSEAREVARRLEQIDANVRSSGFQVAMVYAGLGERHLVLQWLDKARQSRQAHFPFVGVEERFRELRGDPRFLKLLEHAGLRSTQFPRS